MELKTLPEHLSSPPVFCGVRVTRSLVVCVCFVDRCVSVLFLLVIVLSVLLQYTDSDYSFGTFKLLWINLTTLEIFEILPFFEIFEILNILENFEILKFVENFEL